MAVQLGKEYLDQAEKTLGRFLDAVRLPRREVITSYKLLRYYIGLDGARPTLPSALNFTIEDSARRAVLVAVADCCKTGTIHRTIAERLFPDLDANKRSIDFRSLSGKLMSLQVV